MIIVAMAVALAAWPAAARSSPLDDTTLDGAVFTGPAHPHATSMYVNPAALGLDAPGYHFYLGGSLQLDQLDIARHRVLDPDGEPQPGPALDATTWAPAGTLAIYSVGGKVSAGAAIGVPVSERFVSGHEDLGYHVLGGHHLRYGVNLALSLRVHRRIYVGTGLALTNTSMEMSFLRDTALDAGRDPERGVASSCGDAPCGIENPAAAERYDVDVGTEGLLVLATQNLALSFGVVYQVARDWWLGIGVRSPAGFSSQLSLRGTVDITPAPRDRVGPDAKQPLTASAEVVYRLPQTLAIGLRGPLSARYELVTSLRYQTFSRYDQVDLRIFGREVSEDTPEWYPRYRGMRDVVSIEGGVEERPGPRLRLGGRIRLETGALPEEALSPLHIAGFNATLVGGAEYRLSNNLAVAVSYGLSWFPTATVTDSLYDPRDHLACEDQGFDIDACAASAQGRAVPSAAGTYGRLSHAARLSVRYNSF